MKLLITWFVGLTGARERRLLVDGRGHDVEVCHEDSLGAISWRPAESAGAKVTEILMRAIAMLDANKTPPRFAGMIDVHHIAIGTWHNSEWHEGDWRGNRSPIKISGPDGTAMAQGPDGVYR